MNRAGVRDEILSGPGKADEKFRRQHVPFETVAPRAGKDEVARRVSAAMCERMDVVERGEIKLQCGGAVDAPAAAIAHCRELYCSFVRPAGNLFDAARKAGFAGK
jgi:hypothetical protein